MKKFVYLSCLILAVFMVSNVSQAQVRFGVKGGVNMTSLDISTKSIPGFKTSFNKNNTGFFIGPMAEVTIPIIGLGVDGSLLFSQRDKNQMGAEIPLNLKYTFGLGSTLGIFVAAGPDFFFNLSDAKDLKDIALEKKNTQVSLNLGVGLKLIRHLQISANYCIPMGDSFTLKKVGEIKDFSYKSKVWQVSLAYMF